jgi:hypothetical protein
MELHSKTPLLALAAGEVLTLDDARGVRIQARSGMVWVTEEANPRDHIVGPGETIVVSRDGRTVVQALHASWIAIGAANDPLELVTA